MLFRSLPSSATDRSYPPNLLLSIPISFPPIKPMVRTPSRGETLCAGVCVCVCVLAYTNNTAKDLCNGEQLVIIKITTIVTAVTVVARHVVTTASRIATFISWNRRKSQPSLSLPPYSLWTPLLSSSPATYTTTLERQLFIVAICIYVRVRLPFLGFDFVTFATHTSALCTRVYAFRLDRKIKYQVSDAAALELFRLSFSLRPLSVTALMRIGRPKKRWKFHVCVSLRSFIRSGRSGGGAILVSL
jgi:hypothetical protein